jgi:16S rRNA (cytidine1402-2'-O)-methyltransferase
LLARYDIKKSLQRIDAVTELKKADEIAARLETGEHVAFVSDAGTPGISDPGARLVARVRERLPNVKIEAIPGPSALAAALSIAGITADAFTFVGFLPHKKGRQTALKRVLESEIPVILYESPHRIVKLLKELEALQVPRVVVARELTKIHEEVVSGSAKEMQAYFAMHPEAVRGEFVVIVAP